jgi:hypothetical protein
MIRLQRDTKRRTEDYVTMEWLPLKLDSYRININSKRI